MQRTYTNESPESIRKGDKVTDSRGRTFIANGSAEEVLGDYHVNGYHADNNGNPTSSMLYSFTIDEGTTVTLTIEEDDDIYAY